MMIREAYVIPLEKHIAEAFDELKQDCFDVNKVAYMLIKVHQYRDDLNVVRDLVDRYYDILDNDMLDGVINMYHTYMRDVFNTYIQRNLTSIDILAVKVVEGLFIIATTPEGLLDGE